MLLVICIFLTIWFVGDVFCYINASYEVRANHWWSWFPGSGYYAQYLSRATKRALDDG